MRASDDENKSNHFCSTLFIRNCQRIVTAMNFARKHFRVLVDLKK